MPRWVSMTEMKCSNDTGWLLPMEALPGSVEALPGSVEALPGSGLVFGVQMERCLDFSGSLSLAGGSLQLLLGMANQVVDPVGSGQPESRTEFPERDSGPATARPSCHVSTRCCASKRRVLRSIHSVIRRGRLQQYASTIQPLRFTSRRCPSVKRSE